MMKTNLNVKDINKGAVTPISQLNLYTIEDVFKDVRVLSKQTLEYFLYVKIPEGLAHGCLLADIVNILDNSHVDIVNSVQRDGERPWIRIHTSALDTSVGQHTYRFQLVNRFTDDAFSLYISYIIQDNDVDKSYVYMRKDNTEC